AHALAGTKRRPAGLGLRWFGGILGQRELFAARGEELGDVVNRVVLGAGVSAAASAATRPNGLAAVAVWGRAPDVVFGVGMRGMRNSLVARTGAARMRRAEIVEQTRRDFFEKTRRHAGVRQVGAVTAPEARLAQDQLVHGAGHAYVTEAPFFFHLIGIIESA